jgi:cystathionine gamma-synthase
MGASDVLLRVLVRPGDHLVIPHDAYGGTFRLVDKVLAPWGVEYTPVDLADIDALRAALRPTTRVVWCETPTNPLLGVADIAAVADVTRQAGARLVVDNTFASPYLQQPLALGADVVLHSTTKYIGGHSDAVGGALVTSDDELVEQLTFTQNAVGSVPGPFDNWLTLRGAKTLAVRMDRHCDNAERVAEMLVRHPAVARVLYPGLPEDPGHEVAAKQMRRFGGMVSIILAGGREAALRMCAATEVFTLAESLGGVESLIEHPGQMTHMSVAGSALEVPDSLVRLSVGIEDVEDLIEDLRTALDRATV